MKRSHLTCIVLASLTLSLFGPTANADMKVGGAGGGVGGSGGGGSAVWDWVPVVLDDQEQWGAADDAAGFWEGRDAGGVDG